jgi:hypothetical protein
MSAAQLPERIPPFASNEREGREARLLPLGELVRLQGMELGAQDLRQVVVAVGRALAPRVRRWLRPKR